MSTSTIGRSRLSISKRQAITKIQGILVIALVIGVSVVAYYYYSASSPPPTDIILGAPLPLSGTLAAIGQNCQRGHDLAVDEINSAGGIGALGGAKVKIVYADIKSDPTVTTSETERLISTSHPVAIMGAYSSALTYVATEVSERNKVPFIAPMAQADSITDRGFKYVFRQALLASAVGARAVDMVVDMSQRFNTPVKNIAILYENTLAGQTGSAGVRAHAPQVGLTIVYDQSYSQGLSDFSPIIAKVKAANPDVVFMQSYLNDAILIATTFRQLDFNPKAFVALGGGYLEPDFIKSAGKASEFFLAGSGFQRDLSNPPGLSDMVQRYEAKYGVFMNEHAGLCHAATWVIKDVLELSAKLHPDKPLNPDSIRDAFLQIDITSGPATFTAGGRFKVNERGDNIYATHVYLQVINGAQVTVWPFDRAATKPVWPLPPWSQRT